MALITAAETAAQKRKVAHWKFLEHEMDYACIIDQINLTCIKTDNVFSVTDCTQNLVHLSQCKTKFTYKLIPVTQDILVFMPNATS